MKTSVDGLKTIGTKAMKLAKRNLINHGHLVPILIPVRDGFCETVIPIKMIGDSKQRTYRTVSVALSLLQPDAVVLINDAYMKQLSKEAVDTYQNGDLSVDQEASECIVASFKGPSIKPHVLCVPYVKNEVGDIVFKEDMGWVDNAGINLLPDWWKI